MNGMKKKPLGCLRAVCLSALTVYLFTLCACDTLPPIPINTNVMPTLIQSLKLGPSNASTISASLFNTQETSVIIVKCWQAHWQTSSVDPRIHSNPIYGFILQASAGGDSINQIPVLVQVYSLRQLAGGQVLVQMITSNTTLKGMEIEEWSGLPYFNIPAVPGAGIDTVETAVDTSGLTSAMTTDPLNITQPQDLVAVIGMINDGTQVAPTPGANYTARSSWTGPTPGGGSPDALSEDQVVSPLFGKYYVGDMNGAGNGVWAIAAVAFLSSPAPQVGGVAGRPSIASGPCVAHNPWDDTLGLEVDRVRRIDFPPLCAIPKEYRDLLPWDDTFGAIPPGSAQIQKSAGIATPAPAAGDVTIFSFRVPVGYDALLTGFYTGYTGIFTQGNGDLFFRIKVNQRYLLGLSNMDVLLGSPQEPVPLTQGEIVYSGSLVSMIVNIPSTSGIVGGADTVFGGILGFTWPRG